ncbi:hypothetical protein Fmac_028564 [Flemingia macrophylla]|uniref:Uncharacterized protein n=1 Tax=Flemingia macrophylla TaxID=520843 RepID=A0ABD1L9A4_9FABA
MTTILVSVHVRRNLDWMGIMRLMLQTPISDHHSSRDHTLNREDGSQLLALRIRSLTLLQESAASVLPMTTILVFVLLRKATGVDEHPEAYAANTYIRPPQRTADTRHLIEKMAPNS